MLKYILMRIDLADNTILSELKGFGNNSVSNPKYIEDLESTLAKYKFTDSLQDDEYYVFKWNEDFGKPSSVPNRYRDNGNNKYNNKIFTPQELLDNIDEFGDFSHLPTLP